MISTEVSEIFNIQPAKAFAFPLTVFLCEQILRVNSHRAKVKNIKTRKHSSRMYTTRLSTVSRSIPGLFIQGVSTPPRQTDDYENIIFPQLRWRAVKTNRFRSVRINLKVPLFYRSRKIG